ncbi:hypothetical protein HDU96_008582 [Phlyctochytrium bullatum]|nr:hypothetical protein HDU96_008582 [Phlyctochytrium bullatum]
MLPGDTGGGSGGDAGGPPSFPQSHLFAPGPPVPATTAAPDSAPVPFIANPSLLLPHHPAAQQSWTPQPPGPAQLSMRPAPVLMNMPPNGFQPNPHLLQQAPWLMQPGSLPHPPPPPPHHLVMHSHSHPQTQTHPINLQIPNPPTPAPAPTAAPMSPAMILGIPGVNQHPHWQTAFPQPHPAQWQQAPPPLMAPDPAAPAASSPTTTSFRHHLPYPPPPPAFPAPPLPVGGIGPPPAVHRPASVAVFTPASSLTNGSADLPFVPAPHPASPPTPTSATPPLASTSTTPASASVTPPPPPPSTTTTATATAPPTAPPAPQDPARRFPCPDCGRRFLRHQDLERHAPRHLPPDRLPFACACGMRFKRKDALTKHARANRCGRGVVPERKRRAAFRIDPPGEVGAVGGVGGVGVWGAAGVAGAGGGGGGFGEVEGTEGGEEGRGMGDEDEDEEERERKEE